MRNHSATWPHRGRINNGYQALRQPSSTKAIAALLRTVGFDVIETTNLTRDQVSERVLAFGKKADGADIALLYYAGQAVALDGVNYVLGTDAKLKSAADVKPTGIDLDASIDQTTDSAHVRLVFFDAPRTNAFAGAARQKPTVRIVDRPAENRALDGALYLNPQPAPAVPK